MIPNPHCLYKSDLVAVYSGDILQKCDMCVDEGERPRDWKNHSVGAPIASIKCQELGGNYTGSHDHEFQSQGSESRYSSGLWSTSAPSRKSSSHKTLNVFKNFGKCLRQNHFAG